jgi:hypothetical protein
MSIAGAGLVGRDAEGASVLARLAEEPVGARAVLLVGEAGIGKTAVWDWATRRCRDDGYQVLVSRAIAAEARLPWVGLTDLLRAVPDPVLDALPRPQRRALRAVALRSSDGAADERVVGTAFFTALLRLAEAAPVLLAIDDVPDFDPASWQALLFALRRLDGSDVRLLATARGHQADGLFGQGLPAERWHELRLGPLSGPAVLELLRARIGAGLPRPLLLRVHETAGGNPLYALELARALSHLDHQPRAGVPLPVPSGLAVLVDARIRGLRDGVRELAAATADLRLLAGSKSVTMVWFANTAGGEVLKSESQAGAKASSPVKIASAPANGELFDATIGPSGHVWTVTGDDAGNELGVHAEGSTPPSPHAPWPVGFARLAFTGRTAVLVIQQAGTISSPVDYASLTGNKWSAFKPLTGTWSAGYAPGLTTTPAGLRVVTVSAPDFYHPVVASWNGGSFGPAKLIGDTNNCAPNSAETTTDASGRLADITNECGQITIDNLPRTTKAAVVRFAAGRDVVGSTPRIATLPSGRGWAVFALQEEPSGFDELIAAPVLLPALRTKVTGDSAGGDVTVTGPVSCLPVVSTTVAVSAAPASGWHTTSTSLTLGGKKQAGSLDGATLTPGKSYTLTGTASFADGSKKQTATANLTFKACPAP